VVKGFAGFATGSSAFEAGPAQAVDSTVRARRCRVIKGLEEGKHRTADVPEKWLSKIRGADARPMVQGALRALADGEDGPNGLFHPSTSLRLPTESRGPFNSVVDVVIEPMP
jgi:hypothetical protein